MNTGNAYILSTFNSAVFFKDKKAKILHADTGRISDLDGYIWSQFCAIRPEFKKVEFESIDNLLLQTNDESKKYEALELSLELMDTNLSEEYRLGISKILADLLNTDEKLIPFILNRLYSTSTPDSFDEEQALKILLPVFSKAGDFYQNLKAKTTFFSHFYTLLKLGLDLELATQDLVDQVLTDCGCYSKFTISLYEHSKKKYDSAIFESLKKLNELKIAYSPNIFFEIEERLKTDYNIILKNKNSEFSANQKAENINSIATDENDEIINLIEFHFAEKQEKHDFKINKRKNSKKIKAKTADTLDVIGNLIDWAKKYAQKNDDAFLHEFKDVVAKQLNISTPQQICKTCCDLALYFTQINRFTLSKKLLTYAKRLNSEYSYIYTQEAELYKQSGDVSHSLELYDFAIQKFKNNVVPYNGKAQTLRDMGKFEEALKFFDETIKKFNNDYFAYNGKAATLRDMGKFSDALKQYDLTIQKFDEDVVAYSGKAATLRDLGNFEEALKQYDNIIQKFGESIVAYSGRAETLKGMGRFEEALRQYDMTIEKFGENTTAYSGKAETLRDMGRLKEAFNLYDYISQKNPENRIIQTGKFKLLLETDKLESHLKFLVKDSYSSFDDFFDLHIYCMFLIKKGEWDDASLMINKGLKSPYFQNKPYFKGLALYLKILQKEYNLALRYFNQNELNKPIANLLATHAFAATNQISKAKEVLHKLDFIELPVIKITKSYLSERYSLNGYKRSGKSVAELDTLILEGEMKALLQF